MARTYTLKRRAEQAADTRQRIAQAAMELHGTVGPARTTLSMIAERAGVQRNTLYAHFPDERSLFQACSGLFAERSPPPDVAPWLAQAPGGARLRTGLKAIYDWYGTNEAVIACVLRDAEIHDMTRETAAATFGPAMAGWRALLGEGLSGAQPALLHLALGFHSWRALVREAGLSQDAAVEAMARAIEGA